MNTTANRRNTARKWTLIILAIFVLIAIIGGTYSRYSSTAVRTASVDLAKWSVKIDGTQMSSASSGSLPVTLQYVANSNVKEGKLAPGGSANFTLVIDPTDSEVAIDYEVSIGSIAGLTNTNSAIALTSATYTVEGGSAQDATISEGSGTISCTESLADVLAGKTVTIVGTITWDNAADANNAADTENGLNDPTPTASIEITAQQHI